MYYCTIILRRNKDGIIRGDGVSGKAKYTNRSGTAQEYLEY